MNSVYDKFSLDGKVAVITGGAGLLGVMHAKTIAQAGGIPILWDINEERVAGKAKKIEDECSCAARGMKIDITAKDNVTKALSEIIGKFNRVDILINNAANDPKVKNDQDTAWSRLESFSVEMWNKDISVGLTGAFLCSQVVGTYMAQRDGGVILNIASDLGVIAPDQRIYRKEGTKSDQQPVKPVTYSVIKHGIIGLTKYLATYWADKNVRVNSISPGGIHTDQPDEFVQKLTQLIPMGRMAALDDYCGAVLFLVSDASSYMTGANLIVDGGRTCW